MDGSLIAGSLLVAVLAVPIGIASLRVRGASFVIVSIALVLIMLLVFQSWSEVTGGSNGLRVPRPFGEEVLRPEQHERFYYLHAALLAAMLLLWWLIDRSRFGIGLKAIREDEDKAQALGVPTFNYKLVAFIVSAFFTALGGGLYALWFGFLDPVFQFSILIGAYMVLMSLLGGIRSMLGPFLGAALVGYAVEYFKAEYGDSQFHLVATGLLLGVVVLFMPDGIIPALTQLVKRFTPQAASIREVSEADLAEQRRARQPDAVPRPRLGGSANVTTAQGHPVGTGDRRGGRHRHRRTQQVLRRRPRRRRSHGPVPPRKGQRADRAERLGEDDVLQLRHRDDPARQRSRLPTVAVTSAVKAPHRVARAGIGRSFQLCRIFPRMTVMENMLAAVRPPSLRRLLRTGAGPRRRGARA